MSTELEKREKTEVSTTAAERMNEAGISFSPDVDIYVSDDDALFRVDMPGVEKGNVKIEVDETDTLVIRAKNSINEPEKVLVRQFDIGNYFRAFQIGDEFDKEKINGRLENGLLEIRIPKREEAKPKKIAINA
ncbi:MAG: Hsp20/alpha crystallin family protein [Chitinispirillaceae bacterium]|nr:Hsp20/alpha crystallin family protein [Chitinispirillaceae bacterium]